MVDGWKEVRVDELGEIITGKTPKTSILEYYNGNISFLTPSDDMDVKVVNDTKRTLTEIGVESVSRSLLPEKSICVSCIGSQLGKVVMTARPTVTNQQINSIIPNDNYDTDFIYYSMLILGKTLNYISKTSTAVPIINKSEFSSFSILAPLKHEQKAIAHILSSLDEKIQVNNKINKTLEKMAQEIFKHWFVDFEFPNEDGEPYKSSGGEMVESDLGLIPKGWEVKGLDEIASYLNGLAMQKYRPEGDSWGIPVLKIKELRQGFTDENSDRCSIDIDERFIVENGDVIFSWSGSLLVDLWCGDKSGLNQHLFKVTSDEFDKWFYYSWTKYHLDRFVQIAESKATTMGHIKRKDLSDSKVVIPSSKTYIKASSIIEPLYNKMIYGKIESKRLESIRNTLLPKLMSGQIRVPLNIDQQ